MTTAVIGTLQRSLFAWGVTGEFCWHSMRVHEQKKRLRLGLCINDSDCKC